MPDNDDRGFNTPGFDDEEARRRSYDDYDEWEDQ